jgi:hypothetical protein
MPPLNMYPRLGGHGIYLALKMDEDIHLFSIIVQYSTGVDVKIGSQKDMRPYW